MPHDCETQIKTMIGWHQAKMFTPCQQLFRVLYEPSAFPNPPSQAIYDKWYNDVIATLKSLDDKLISKGYLAADKLTIADIIVFSEISQFLFMTGKTFEDDEFSEYAFLIKWFNLVKSDRAIQFKDEEFKQAMAGLKKTLPK